MFPSISHTNFIGYRDIQSKSGFFCPTKCTGKESKTPIRKKTVFDNKLHNVVATYSNLITMKPICNIIYGIYNTFVQKLSNLSTK